MNCSICFNNIFETNKVITECNHIFHFTCIYDNFKNNPNTGGQCPLCRKNYNTKFQNPQTTTTLSSIVNSLGEQHRQIIRQLYNRTRPNSPVFNNLNRRIVQRPQNTLIREINHRRRINRQQTPETLRRREIKNQITQLSFESLKNKLREKGVSSRGYLRETLEKRLFDKIMTE